MESPARWFSVCSRRATLIDAVSRTANVTIHASPDRRDVWYLRRSPGNDGRGQLVSSARQATAKKAAVESKAPARKAVPARKAADASAPAGGRKRAVAVVTVPEEAAAA